MTDLRSKETLLRQSGADCFTHCVDYSLEQIVKTNETLVTTGLIIPIFQLSKLVDGENIAMLFERLEIQKLQSFRIHQLPPSISKILENCIDHSLTDSLKALQLQARVLDYLCSLILHLGSEIVTIQNQNPAKARARAIHNFLINTGAETPTLTDLGEKFGGSPNKLNAEFMNEYGESIFSFLTNYRLEQAHFAIEKSGQPLKVIAHRIGYSHVNHFITAFKRKYDYTPGSLRQ